MLGIYVHVPIACFRKGLAREYLETESLPPPSTCYGFLLSLVGETNRHRHVGARVAPQLIGRPDLSVVLRTVWRVKSKPLGSSGNTRPDYQQLLSDVRLVMWLDSSNETNTSEDDTLETRVGQALDADNRHGIKRFGGLSLGESTHLVNEVVLLDRARAAADWSQRVPEDSGQAFLVHERGRLTLPVWVDHVGSAGTRYTTGNLEHAPLQAPNVERVPMILPPD
ncbi:MAG: type I-MYXAN CRISPR-associated protein Cas5/Cmx5/DevS [Planctomycetota bacterium]|nr:type I-MYXAN CRISPR-associated protein Cas5/Cmx5/DevS [Planctomycetota bacterium]